jgi:hypothetical protein
MGLRPLKEIDEPLWSFCRRIGPVDFSNLVLAKALEIGVVEEAIVRIEGRRHYGFRRVELLVHQLGSEDEN